MITVEAMAHDLTMAMIKKFEISKMGLFPPTTEQISEITKSYQYIYNRTLESLKKYF